jgi:hypothetical protein
MNYKECKRCGETRKLSEYRLRRSGSTIFHESVCIPCIVERQMANPKSKPGKKPKPKEEPKDPWLALARYRPEDVQPESGYIGQARFNTRSLVLETGCSLADC